MATTLADIKRKIHEYFIESEKGDGEVSLTRHKGEYPNAVILTKTQYTDLIKEMFNLDKEVSEDVLLEVKVLAIEGLEVILTEYIEEPKVIRLEKKNPS